MADKQKKSELTPPEVPGPDAGEDEMRAFEEAKREYEEQRVAEQIEAAQHSEQTQNAP